MSNPTNEPKVLSVSPPTEAAPSADAPQPWVAPFPTKGNVVVQFADYVTFNGTAYQKGVNYTVDASVAQGLAHVARAPNEE